MRDIAIACLLVFFTLLAVSASAVDTERFEIESFERWSKGTAEGVEIGSKGELKSVGAAESFEAPAEGVWSVAPVGRGRVYMGTGNEGRLLLFKDGEMEEVADTDHVALTRVRYHNEEVWVSAIPGGALYKLTDESRLQKVLDTEEEYLWDFIFDGRDILVATGPGGKILKVSSSGEIEGVVETGEAHVLCLLKAEDGKIYAGTSEEGLVLELVGKHGYRVVHDFDEEEVKGLAWADGTLIAATNEEAGRRPGKGPSVSVWERKREEEAQEDQGGEQEEGHPQPEAMIEKRPAPRGGGKVTGAVYALNHQGGARMLVKLPNRAAVEMAVQGKDVFIATDQEGKVYRCRPHSSDYAITFDLSQAQALSLAVDDKGAWIGTGSPAALVRVKKEVFQKPRYTTEVLDAKFPARWGELSLESEGAMVSLSTRSGNISDPERGWSKWEHAGLGKDKKIKSPDARYLQVRIEWPLKSAALVRSISVPYKIYNQPHFLESVEVENLQSDGDKNNRKKRRGKGANNDDNGPPEHDAVRKVQWKVTNPDEDALAYELYFQPQGTSKWIKIKTAEPVTKTEFEWNTASVPDGWYRIKVVASDGPDNTPGQAIRAEKVFERVLVDNTAPRIKRLNVSRNSVSGKAVDDTSDVSGIQYSIDGGEWNNAGPEDGVLDSKSEKFEFELPRDIPAGTHIIAVRAWDRALNLGLSMESFEK